MSELTFDLGQTGFRGRIFVNGQFHCEVAGGGYRMGTSLEEALSAIAEEAARISGIHEFSSLSGGLTGVYGQVGDAQAAIENLRERFGTTRLIVADDAVTSYLGARGDRSGVVVAIGTGLVALGRADDGTCARVDGLGAMIGDEGAGWWIGRQGLIAALSAADGRDGASPRLLKAAQREYGPVETLASVIARADSPIASVAGFAKHVAEAARTGDFASTKIWDNASLFIARAILAAAERSKQSSPIEYTLIGGIAEAVDLLEPGITHHLRDHFADSERQNALGTSLDGASLLLKLPDIHSLGPLARETTLTEDAD